MKRTILFALFLSFIGIFGHTYAQQRSNVSVRKIGGQDSFEKLDQRYRDFRATIGGGYAYRLGKAEKYNNNKLDDLMSSLRHGYNLDAEVQYFFKESWGLGLNINYVKQSASATNIKNLPGFGDSKYYKESNQFVYVGPAFIMRNEGRKFAGYMSIGFGPIFYTPTIDSDILNGSLNHTAFGTYISASGEYKINQNIGIGLKMAVTAGRVSIVGEQQNVSNLSIGTYLSFRSSK